MVIPIALVVAAVAAISIYTYNSSRSRSFSRNAPKITLRTEYQNPFEVANQFVNPFAEYKSPFDNLK